MIQGDQFAENVISQEMSMTDAGANVGPFILLARLYTQKRSFANAEEYARKAIDVSREHADAWSMLGTYKVLVVY